jgi:hypothetical protein
VTDNGSITVEVVPGEMQPWSDAEGSRPPAGGPALRALLDDVLPRASRALIAGPHERDVVELVAARSEYVTVLLRSVSDATALDSALAATNVTVVAGALDGFVNRGGRQRYDVVVAADGLDRLLGTDSAALDWPQRASALARAAGTDGVVVVGCANEFALTGLLDRRPVDNRHRDDEWRPLHDDPLRPASPEQLTTALADAGFGGAALYAVFGAEGRPHAIVDVPAAAATRPGRPAARLAVRALEAATAQTPLLAPPADAADAAARAGLLAAVAPGWIAVCGGASGGHSVYAEAGAPGSMLTADRGTHGWQVRVVAGEPRELSEPGDLTEPVVAFSPDALPALVPDTDSVERVLLRLAAADDVPGFRQVAARLGEWARDQDGGGAGPTPVLCFEDLGVDGDTFAFGLSGWVTAAAAAPAELLAAAWHRFQDRLLAGHRRHPWPPWMVGDDLVSAWLAMSGEEATAATVKRGREIADGVAAAVAAGQGGDPEIDLRTALADAEAGKLKAHELAGHIFGLERTIRFRDQQLKVREDRIRALRLELRTIKGSRAAKLAGVIQKAAKIRHPRQFAGGVKRRLRRALQR